MGKTFGKTLTPKEQEIIEDKSDDNEKNLKYKEIFSELSNEKMGEIYSISREINFNNLTYHFTGSNIAPINCIRGSMRIYNELKNGNISTEKIEEDQKQFKSKLNEITIGNQKHKSKNQLDTIKNITFITQETKLSNYIMIMLKLYLKLCTKQNRQQHLKY